VKPEAKRKAAHGLIASFGLSKNKACRITGLRRATFDYKSRKKPDTEIRELLKEIAHKRRRFGAPRLYIMVRRKGINVNHKKIERIYKEENLQIKNRKKKKLTRFLRIPAALPERPGERWSMDFMSDSFGSGRKFRTLNVVDDFTRECLAIEVDTSLPGKRVVQVLERLIGFRGKPKAIVCDNGPEFIGRVVDKWAYDHNISLDYIDPGKPNQNCFVESFNGKFRDECLNDNWFLTIQHARKIISSWRDDYNFNRPHSSLNDLTPFEFKKQKELKLTG
jgi:putative transposase